MGGHSEAMVQLQLAPLAPGQYSGELIIAADSQLEQMVVVIDVERPEALAELNVARDTNGGRWGIKLQNPTSEEAQWDVHIEGDERGEVGTLSLAKCPARSECLFEIAFERAKGNKAPCDAKVVFTSQADGSVFLYSISA